jgi:hypothetical protein
MGIPGNVSLGIRRPIILQNAERKRLLLNCSAHTNSQETKNTAPRLFVFGLGFTGKGLAKLTLERGW